MDVCWVNGLAGGVSEQLVGILVAVEVVVWRLRLGGRAGLVSGRMSSLWVDSSEIVGRSKLDSEIMCLCRGDRLNKKEPNG